MAQLIDGKARAKELRKSLKERVSAFTEQVGHAPGLGVLLVGADPASAVYVRNKERACKKTGIRSFHHELPEDATQEQVEGLIDQLNADPEVHGILLQLPLPSHLDAQPLLLRIRPEKDADGFHPVNAGRLASGTYCLSAITLGRRSSQLGECTATSYSETIFTRSRKAALTASCHGQSESGK